MSTLSLDNYTWIDTKPEKNIFWLNTYYDSLPYNIANMKTNIVWKSERIRPQYVDILLEFQFERISELEFRVTCMQTPFICAKTINYHLRFYSSINVFKNELKIFQMPNSQNTISESFFLDASYPQHFDLNKLFELKIIVKMIEYDCTSTDMYFHQESELRKLKEEYFGYEYVLDDLCYILKIPIFQDIFTGQQNNVFARKKINYIRRTALFSEGISFYLRSGRENKHRPRCIDMDYTLNYILNEDKDEPITNEDLIKLYFEAQVMGLNFLLELCRIHMSLRARNLETAIDVLLVADRVKDNILFDEILRSLYSWWKDHSYPKEWIEALRNSSIECRFLVDVLEGELISLDKDDLNIRNHPGSRTMYYCTNIGGSHDA